MKAAAILMGAALVAGAQTPAMKQATPMVPVARATGAGSERPGGSLAGISMLEKEMDGRLSTTGSAINDPCYLMGAGTRGLYISGVGAIFMADVDLVNSPGSPFSAGHTPAEKAAVRKRKEAHVPLLQQTMRDMAQSIAASPSLKLADNEQVVIVVRLVYRAWEDTVGLPGQISARIERRGGPVVMEVQ